MSRTFWLRRKRLATEKAKAANNETAVTEKTSATEKAPKKTAKKAVKSSDSTTD